MGLGANLALAMLDLSEDGAALLLKEPLQNGEEVQLEFSRAARYWHCCIPAEAVWCILAADDNYCAGLRFSRRLAYRDVQEMVETPIMR